MSKNQLPPLSERRSEPGMRKAQKRAGFIKVPDRLRVFMFLYKPARRIAPAKIRHAHSCPLSSGRTCAPPMPDGFLSVPAHFLTISRLHLLLLMAGPSVGVSSHWVRQTSRAEREVSA